MIKHEIINPITLTNVPVIIDIKIEFAKAFKKVMLNIMLEKSEFIKSVSKITIGENKKIIKNVIIKKSIIFINL